MTFTLSPSVLSSAIKSLGKIVPRKPLLPVFENILFRPSSTEGIVSLSASDGDNMLTVDVALDEYTDLCPFLFPADKLQAGLSGMGQFPVTIEIDHDEVRMSDVFGEFCFMGSHEADVFPVIPQVDGQQITLPAAAFSDAVTASLRFTANDDMRPVMCGVYLDFKEGTMNVAASDSRKLFMDSVRVDAMAEPVSVIINASVISSLVATTASSETITLVTDGKRLSVDNGGARMTVKLIEGKYPRVESILPKNNTRVVTINRAALVAAIERASVAADVATCQLKVSFNGATDITIEARDVNFSTSAKITAKTEQQQDVPVGFAFGVRSTYILDILKTAFKTYDTVSLMMYDPTRAILIKGDASSARTALVMPMQLTAF